MVDYISSTCRICLVEVNRKISLFDCQNASSYSDLIKEYVGTEVIENENLPSSICEACSRELMVVVKFVSNFRLSTLKLKGKSLNKVNLLRDFKKDDDNIPLSAVSADIKQEEVICNLDSPDCCYPTEHSDEENSTLKLKGKSLNKVNLLRDFKKDDDNIPLSAVSADIKQEEVICNLDSPDCCYPTEHNEEENSTLKLKSKSLNKINPLRDFKKDDDNLPSSAVSAAIKQEEVICNLDSPDFYPTEHSDEESSDSKFIPQYRIAKSSECGLKKDMVKCLTCGLLVQNKSAFIVHNRKHTGEKPCKCAECGKCFTQVGSLNDHIRKHHLKESSQAGGALAEAVKKMRLKEKFGEYRFTCDACGKRFWKKGALTIHLRVHTREKPYQCLYCPKRFAQYSEHLQHTRIHTGERPYSCNICGKKFISHSPLQRHLSVHSDERKYKCQICGTAVKSSDSLKKHILVTHTYEKRIICELCGAGFAVKYNLKTHMKARHSERSGVCEICKKSFSNLSKHMNTHSADKPFACHMCNKRFFRQKGLEAHLSKHQDETPTFSCSFEECQSVFPKQSKLDFHVLKYHTNHTPHICQLCSKGFYRLADLRKHIKSVHDKSDEMLHVPNNVLYL